MECKFASNGLAIDYSGTIKPCCVFRTDDEYRIANHINQVDLANWHRSHKMIEIRQDLASGRWPGACEVCQDFEKSGRGDSMRLNGQQAYGSYGSDDITLEIRGGYICNFACQTCWPQASSRVAHFYKKTGRTFRPNSDVEWQFDRLDGIKDRIKNIVILGGEPFYDPRCQELFAWLRQKSINAHVTVFTNGSVIDRDFVENYQGRLTLVLSLDAVGRAAEYVRYGTDWPVIQQHYGYYRQLSHIDFRVNITTSPYNYCYLPDLIDWMIPRWPDLLTWGQAGHSLSSRFMDETVIPLHKRKMLVDRLEITVEKVKDLDIDHMQRINTSNAIESIIANLKQLSFDAKKYHEMTKFIHDMDLAKGISIRDYCPEAADCLDISLVRLA